jgi:hypothetical protein
MATSRSRQCKENMSQRYAPNPCKRCYTAVIGVTKVANQFADASANWKISGRVLLLLSRDYVPDETRRPSLRRKPKEIIGRRQ